MRLVAIDPGSNKMGLAFFRDGILTSTATLETEEKEPAQRRYSILKKLELEIYGADLIASEAPVLMGANNNGMQRVLGVVEFLTQANAHFFHPMTVKAKIAGTGKADKLELALAAGRHVQTAAEQEIIAEAISQEAWDETDAVAIGLCFLNKQKQEREAND